MLNAKISEINRVTSNGGNYRRLNMKNVRWDPKNPFMPVIKTAEDARNFIAAGGIACVESKIEKTFGQRVDELKEKIRRLKTGDPEDVFLLNLLANSILVDCRALFLENKSRSRNATLQNVYLARSMHEESARVDQLLNMEAAPGKTARQVIKGWVDQRIVHIDWLWDEQEEQFFDDIKTFLLNAHGGGLLALLDELIEDYDRMRSTFGDNLREQIDQVFAALTG